MISEPVRELGDATHYRLSAHIRCAPIERVLLSTPKLLHAGPDAGRFEARKENRIERSAKNMVAIGEPLDSEPRREPLAQLAMRVRVVMILRVPVDVLVQQAKERVRARSAFDGDETDERAAWTKHALNLVERTLDVVHVLQHVAG